MEINKINDNTLGINKVQNTKKTQKPQSTPAITVDKDVVDLSSRSSEYKEIYAKVIDIINKTPDIRTEKVALIKENLNSLKNISNEKLTEIASKILTDLTHIQ